MAVGGMSATSVGGRIGLGGRLALGFVSFGLGFMSHDALKFRHAVVVVAAAGAAIALLFSQAAVDGEKA